MDNYYSCPLSIIHGFSAENPTTRIAMPGADEAPVHTGAEASSYDRK